MRNSSGFPSDIAFTDAVKAQQTRMGSRRAYAHMEEGSGWNTSVSPELEAELRKLRG